MDSHPLVEVEMFRTAVSVTLGIVVVIVLAAIACWVLYKLDGAEEGKAKVCGFGHGGCP